jgi:hypothetical protein
MQDIKEIPPNFRQEMIFLKYNKVNLKFGMMKTEMLILNNFESDKGYG